MMNVEKNNKQIISSLVKEYFSLNEKSFNRFEKELQNKFVDKVYANIINNSKDLRRKIKIPSSKMEGFDKGWEKFQEEFPSFCMKTKIKYEDFRNNLVRLKKQKIKLIKALKEHYNIEDGNYSLLSKMESIGVKKLPNKELELVLTLNFADWFLCSSAEKWTSCMNLESDYEGSYWSGLPGLINDKNRAMIYITDGTKKKYRGIEVDKVLSRTWALLDADDCINIVKSYPASFLRVSIIKDLLGDCDVRLLVKNLNFFSKYCVDFLYFTNKKSCYIYQDYTFIKDEKGRMLYTKSTGYEYFENGLKYSDNIFDYAGGLKHLIDNKMEIEKCIYAEFHCYECDTSLHEDDCYWYRDTAYCERCFSDHFAYCNFCDEPYRKRDMTHINDEYICNECLTDNFGQCEECSEWVEKDDIHIIENDECICVDCLNKRIENEKIFYCGYCSDYILPQNIVYLKETNEHICKKCLQEKIDEKQLSLDLIVA